MIINHLLTGMVLHVEKRLFFIASHVLVYQRMYTYSPAKKTPASPVEHTGETPSTTCFCFGNPFILPIDGGFKYVLFSPLFMEDS